MKPVLITGASGFIGSHVAQVLIDRHIPVRMLVRKPGHSAFLPSEGEVLKGDLSDPTALKTAVSGVQAVIHAGALTRARHPADFYRINRDSTLQLYRMAADFAPDCRVFIFISSQAAAGPSTPGNPRRESDPEAPVSHYGQSKLEAEEQLVKIAGPSLTVLRFSAVYGPRDREIFPFFKAASRGWIPRLSPPEGTLQLLYVKDAADAVIQACESMREGTFFIAHPRVFKQRQLIQILSDVTKRPVRTFPVHPVIIRLLASANAFLARISGRTAIFNPGKARELLAPSWTCNTERMENVLNFHPEIDFPVGAGLTYQWYRDQKWIN